MSLAALMALPIAARAQQPADTAAAVEEQTPTWGAHPLATSGLYPIWEDTGSLLSPSSLELSTSGVRAGLLERLQLGVQPNYLLHRAPNLELKVALYSRPGLQVALRQSAVVLFRDAQERMITPVYASRLANPDSTVWLLPASVHASWQPFTRLRVHGSATLLPLLSNQRDFDNQLSAGLAAMVELPVLPGNSLLLHAGEAGLWDHDFAYVGASYRLNYRAFLLQFGYAYRLRPEGVQGSPMLNLGVYL